MRTRVPLPPILIFPNREKGVLNVVISGVTFRMTITFSGSEGMSLLAPEAMFAVESLVGGLEKDERCGIEVWIVEGELLDYRITYVASGVDLYCLLRGIAADVLCDPIVPDSLLTQSFEAVRPQSCIFARVAVLTSTRFGFEDALGFISDITVRFICTVGSNHERRQRRGGTMSTSSLC